MKTAIIRIYLEYIRYRMGLRSSIPAYFINKICVNENGTSLVNIINDDMFCFDDSVKRRGVFLVRADLVPMLHAASRALPAGYRLFFYHGYRPRLYQWVLWLQKINAARSANPGMPDADIERDVRATVACPKNGYGPHQTGGAVDVTIVDCNGVQLDMGTAPLHLGIESVMNYKNITPVQRNNRKILASAMQQAGFNNYPAEWWHWSYGDQMWAAYQHKPFAIYGEVESPLYILTDEEKQILAQNKII